MAQYLLPIANVGTTNWTQCQGDGDSDWFDELDSGFGAGRGTGSGPDTGTSWATPSTPANEAIRVKLSAGTDPGVHTGHIIRLHHRKTSSGNCALTSTGGEQHTWTVTVFSGATQIEQWTFVNNVDWTTHERTLAEANVANATDYQDWEVEVSVDETAFGSARRSAMAEVEMQIPDATAEKVPYPLARQVMRPLVAQ